MIKKYLFLLCAIMLMTMACKPSERESAVFSVNPEQIKATSDGGIFQLTIGASSLVRAVVKYDGIEDGWIQLLPSTLTGTGIIQVTIDRYDNPLEQRSATITVSSESQSKDISVIQEPAGTIKLSLTSLITLDEARSYGVTVQSTKPWTAEKSEGADWLTITERGEANGSKLTVTTTELPDFFTPREATIKIQAEGLSPQYLKVSQGYGVLINGIIWAKYDVGNPGEFCEDFETIPPVYQYNSKIPYSLVPFVSGGPNKDESEPSGWDGNPYNGTDTWLMENDPCPEGWRIPTAAEMAELIGATYTSEDIVLGTERKFSWGWYYNHQGVYAGNTNSSQASKSDFKGNIFIVYAGYRGDLKDGYIYGTQPEADRVWRQTITRPSHNWSRICLLMNWNNDIDTWWMDNPYAVAIRPVADLVTE